MSLQSFTNYHILLSNLNCTMPTNLTLTSDKSEVNTGNSETATLTATLTNVVGDPIPSQSINFFEGNSSLGSSITTIINSLVKVVI